MMGLTGYYKTKLYEDEVILPLVAHNSWYHQPFRLLVAIVTISPCNFINTQHTSKKSFKANVNNT